MSICVIFGGAGFVGTHLTNFFLENKRFSKVHIADINKSPLDWKNGVTISYTDVREKIDLSFLDQAPDWIFNFAAIHREPGHAAKEFFETNIKGAENVCNYAKEVGCNNLFFTSSIAIYGPTHSPTDETKFPAPTTPYGGSKYPAELIHKCWQKLKPNRRLIITRPGVIYGPGDPGNILRMIRAIKKGYFVFPGSKKIFKSYAYIYGFIESIDFTMKRSEELIIYNYVETPTESIEQLTKIVKDRFNSNAPIVSLPIFLLMPLANILQKIKKESNPIHPVRVRKAGTPTHIVPMVLSDMGFSFNYDFKNSLEHWEKVCKEDFI